MSVNVDLLNETMQFIKDNPERHDQANWCGTAQCFAGWAVALDGWNVDQREGMASKDGVQLSVPEAALKSLGMPVAAESWWLFRGGNTVEMLELMVKDLSNGETLDHPSYYHKEAHQEEYK